MPNAWAAPTTWWIWAAVPFFRDGGRFCNVVLRLIFFFPPFVGNGKWSEDRVDLDKYMEIENHSIYPLHAWIVENQFGSKDGEKCVNKRRRALGLWILLWQWAQFWSKRNTAVLYVCSRSKSVWHHIYTCSFHTSWVWTFCWWYCNHLHLHSQLNVKCSCSGTRLYSWGKAFTYNLDSIFHKFRHVHVSKHFLLSQFTNCCPFLDRAGVTRFCGPPWLLLHSPCKLSMIAPAVLLLCCL